MQRKLIEIPVLKFVVVSMALAAAASCLAILLTH
jgi:hypothetical protein